MMKEQMTIIDMLSVLCFYLTLQTIDDTRMLEKHLEQQDNHIKEILEVLKNDNR